MTKQVPGTLLGDSNVIYFDPGDGYPDTYMCENSSGCIFERRVFTVCSTSIKI